MSSAELPELDPEGFLSLDIFPQKNVSLSKLGSFRLGGPVACLLNCHRPEDLGEVRKILSRQGQDALLIGEGSNVLFSDEGWPGVMVRFTGGEPVPVDEGQGKWRFPASANLQAAVDWATREGWAGLESFNGIPGSLGGAVVGNAGAWGVQMEHVLCEVYGFGPRGEQKKYSVADCGFSYRNSKLKTGELWVSEVILQLEPGEKVFLEGERKRILDLRNARHPDWEKEPCIGSFFKNLEPSSAAERRQAAGYFLEQAGAKAFQVGGAGVYTGHANILVKRNESCRAADVAQLARELQAAVKKMHGIDLEREVRYLGNIPGEPGGAGFY
ncbi:UDP-N-acetylmuramate dehydrogenase [Kiritimatiellaeota bacterium B1221]|nr:UDP-N-acetylmuramate dehydrogenase [Kiritimatiellaeota bacterium B1221]